MSVHRLPLRVYYEDTDFTGVVYHANYLRFMERGRTELLRDLGLHHRELFTGEAGKAFGFVVRAMQIEFLKPAVMDDLVTVETSLTSIRGASAHMLQRVVRGEDVLVTAEIRVGAVADGRATRLPDDVRAKLLGKVERV